MIKLMIRVKLHQKLEKISNQKTNLIEKLSMILLNLLMIVLVLTIE